MIKKVIIVEDSVGVNYLISTVLKKDFDITSVNNYADAMLHLQTDADRDLIIIDIPDSESDNFGFLEHIATSCVFNDIQTIVISDSNDPQLKSKTAKLGASLFLTKPFDPVYLSNKVGDLFINKQQPVEKKRKFSVNLNIFW